MRRVDEREHARRSRVGMCERDSADAKMSDKRACAHRHSATRSVPSSCPPSVRPAMVRTRAHPHSPSEGLTGEECERDQQGRCVAPTSVPTEPPWCRRSSSTPRTATPSAPELVRRFARQNLQEKMPRRSKGMRSNVYLGQSFTVLPSTVAWHQRVGLTLKPKDQSLNPTPNTCHLASRRGTRP
jgi:hypothetical protein